METPTGFKLELSKEWLMLQTHKYRRPKWIKFPRSMLEDERWLKLSDRARSAMMCILVIATENPNSELPTPEALFRRLRGLGISPRKDSFSAVINELIQCGFILKTTPELQSLRVKHTSHSQEAHESRVINLKERKEEKGSGEEVRADRGRGQASKSRPQTSQFLRLREAARAAWGDRAASLVGAAYHRDGCSEDEILETMRGL